MRTSCPHLSLSLSLLSQAYIGDAVWELALRSRELDTARALAGVRPRVAARARAEYQAAALRELEKSGCLSTEELYVSLSLSLSHHHPEHEDLYARMCVVERETDINRVRGRCRSLVRWGRNASVKIPNRLLAHGSAGPRVYKSATALECLLGSLHVQGEHARVHVLIAWICTNVAT